MLDYLVMETISGPYKCQGLDRIAGNACEVTAAMSRVARHEFVPQKQVAHAYEDRALPIGCGQTISQPYIVALMTAKIGNCAGQKVLEIGTGSGYQAAVLSEMGVEVFSIEIVPELAKEAAENLATAGYSNVCLKTGDGSLGWPEHAPFSAVLITASCPKIPPALFEQLADGGRLIAPLEQRPGSKGKKVETLMIYTKRGNQITSADLGAVKFVPLTGEIRKTAGD